MPKKKTPEIIYISDNKSLAPLFELVEKQPTLYMDLEVDNMYHYFTKVSLLQILIEDKCYIIDFMEDFNVKQLLNALENKTLVMHGADFDLRTLYNLHGFNPKKVFDTMLAARLTGKEKFGLGALVEEYFEVKLNKKFQKADWSERPLSDEMLEYAAQDTLYLPELYDTLKNVLEKDNRIGWHNEWCEFLISSSKKLKEIDEESIWRVKGSSKLQPRQLVVLKNVFYWREKIAKDQNKPLYKVLTNESMLKLAHAIPELPKKINSAKLPLKTSRNLKKQLSEIVSEAVLNPEETWPQKLKRKSGSKRNNNPKIIEFLKKVRDDIADKLGLHPSLLANKEALTALAQANLNNLDEMADKSNLMNWQQDLLFKPWSSYSSNIKV